jgi:hypothetical protein
VLAVDLTGCGDFLHSCHPPLKPLFDCALPLRSSTVATNAFAIRSLFETNLSLADQTFGFAHGLSFFVWSIVISGARSGAHLR